MRSMLLFQNLGCDLVWRSFLRRAIEAFGNRFFLFCWVVANKYKGAQNLLTQCGLCIFGEYICSVII